ncbi:FAD-dependent oxidoreductase [Candidatus Uhrbacteria bacterium]|nr:MAG: FAD-dependent oxidoreductase [Candidatus Uhrbacteria bacterium]
MLDEKSSEGYIIPMGKPRVVILGAGLAGLACADLLSRRGYDVTVVEARGRIGGRVMTERLGPYLVEMGGEWIGTEHRRMQSLCRRFGIPLRDHRLRKSLLLEGSWHAPGTWAPSRKLLTCVDAGLRGMRSPGRRRALEQMDAWTYLAHCGVRRADEQALELFMRAQFGESMRGISATEVLPLSRKGEDIDSTDVYWMEGGNTRLIEALADTVGRDRIFLRHTVDAVVQIGTSLTVLVRNGRAFKGDAVICTLPAPQVAKLHWRPSLRTFQAEAFYGLPYARVTKTAIHFPKRFWKDAAFDVFTDTVAGQIYHATQCQPGRDGVLTSYATGPEAVRMANATLPEAASSICHALRPVFGPVNTRRTAVRRKAWHTDPFAGGAYAVFGTRSTEYEHELGIPHGKVLFAGEHTVTRNQGYMEGAVESARHAVRLLKNRLRI